MRLTIARHWLVVLVWACLAVAGRAAEDAPVVKFLSAKDAGEVLGSDKPEAYISRLQAPEMAAKTGEALTEKTLAAQREECRKRYQASAMDFNDDEKKALTTVAAAVHAKVKDLYPLWASQPWCFIKTNGSVEGSLPHTRGDCIVFGQQFTEMFAAAIKRMPAGKDAGNSRLGELLLHEQCHVLQRKYPKLFADLYTKTWGFVHVDKIASTPELDQRQVLNPDGPDINWLFPSKDADGKDGFVQPMVAFRANAEEPKMPRDFRSIAVRVKQAGKDWEPVKGADGAATVLDLSSVKEFEDKFGTVGENFHPNEIFAVLFGQMVLKDANKLADREGEFPGLGALREWCGKNLKKAP